MRSANPPTMSAGVMIAKVSWKAAKIDSGIVPLIESSPTPLNRNFPTPPTRLPPPPNARL